MVYINSFALTLGHVKIPSKGTFITLHTSSVYKGGGGDAHFGAMDKFSRDTSGGDEIKAICSQNGPLKTMPRNWKLHYVKHVYVSNHLEKDHVLNTLLEVQEGSLCGDVVREVRSLAKQTSVSSANDKIFTTCIEGMSTAIHVQILKNQFGIGNANLKKKLDEMKVKMEAIKSNGLTDEGDDEDDY